MKFVEFKDTVLQLINQYSANGVVIDNLYNDHSDYVLRIPALFNSAVTDISVNGKPYLAVIDRMDVVHDEPHIHEGHRHGCHNEEHEGDCQVYGHVPMHHHHHHHGLVKIQLPGDFIAIHDSMLIDNFGRIGRDNSFHALGDGTALVSAEILHGDRQIVYEREPKKLDITPGADIEGIKLDGDSEQIYAAAYYVAAQLVLGENANVHAILRNEYDDRLTKMKRRMSAETNLKTDVYTPFMWGGAYS